MDAFLSNGPIPAIYDLNHAYSTFLRDWPLFWGRNLFGRKIFRQVGWNKCIGCLDKKMNQLPPSLRVAAGFASQHNLLLIVTAVLWSWEPFDCITLPKNVSCSKLRWNYHTSVFWLHEKQLLYLYLSPAFQKKWSIYNVVGSFFSAQPACLFFKRIYMLANLPAK